MLSARRAGNILYQLLAAHFIETISLRLRNSKMNYRFREKYYLFEKTKIELQPGVKISSCLYDANNSVSRVMY